MKKNEIAPDLIKKYGQLKIDEVLAEADDVAKIQNDFLFDEAMKLLDEYFLCSLGGKMLVMKKSDPVHINWDVTNAAIYFKKFCYTKYEITSIVEKNDKLTYTSNLSEFPLFFVWLDKTQRYDGLKFNPDKPAGSLQIGDCVYWNTWNGWAVKPSNEKSCDIFLGFIQDVICAGDDKKYKFVMDFLSHMFQFPAQKHPKILVLRGKQGEGKGTLTDCLERLAGSDYSCSVDTHVLTGKFNSQLYGKILVVADEACWAGERKGWSALKRLTGQIIMPIELKGKDVFFANNYLRVIVTTNDDYASPIEQDNRRVVAMTTSPVHLGDTAFWKALRAELDNGGYEALMYIFMNRKIETDFFGAVEIYDEDAVEDCRLESLSSENLPAKWLYDCFLGNAPKESNLFFAAYDKTKVDSEAVYDFDGKLISARVLFNRYKLWVDSSGEKKQINSIQFGKHLSKLIVNKTRKTSGVYYQIDKAEIKPTLEKVLGFKIKEIEEDDSGQDE